ncbi:MAG: methyltransferase domain-containing protein [Acidobacteria bacterium]|nr:methyltransferase domain-containing protein [Acidobacteriota bacterium]
MKEHPYVGRGGLKLEHGLRSFGLSVEGLICADLGCSTGGFTDCLLQHGAAKVVAVDTGYGVLDYKLRIDPRVEVRERTNALHAEPPEGGVDLVVADLSWTRQERFLPVARRWLRKNGEGRILTLVKPHYEVDESEKPSLVKGVLPDDLATEIVTRLLTALPARGYEVLGQTPSPIRGGGSRSGKGGNLEFLVLLKPAEIQ